METPSSLMFLEILIIDGSLILISPHNQNGGYLNFKILKN